MELLFYICEEFVRFLAKQCKPLLCNEHQGNYFKCDFDVIYTFYHMQDHLKKKLQKITLT